jgi:hypothetical protein
MSIHKGSRPSSLSLQDWISACDQKAFLYSIIIKQYGGISISKNAIKSLWVMLFASLILALFPCVQAQAGICPNYYGPIEPNPYGQSESCQNMMSPGTYNIQWAHGPESNWDWQYFDTLDMQANTRYVLTYSMGGLSIDESEDASLTGYTVICGRNEESDALVFCLEPV